MANEIELHVTLWPSFPHFERTIADDRVDGMRLNGPVNMDLERIRRDVEYACGLDAQKLYFDVKGAQLRVLDVRPYKDHLELKVTHGIEVDRLPATVIFKDGKDYATVVDVQDDVLIFDGGPRLEVLACEPIYFRGTEYCLKDGIISPYERERIGIAKRAGITKFMLSYVRGHEDIDTLRKYVGDNDIYAKIESMGGLEYAQKEYVPTANTRLMLGRGDLYVELGMPHDIIDATKRVIAKDPHALVASRLLHSLRTQSVPECADFSELAWLHSLGYRKFMLCDELCLRPDLLTTAINVFDAFRTTIDCPSY